MNEKKLRGIAKVMDLEKEVLLEYYIIQNNNCFGFEIDESIKVLGSNELKLCEKYVSNNDTWDKDETNKILDTFIRNSVTPVAVENILEDMEYFKG